MLLTASCLAVPPEPYAFVLSALISDCVSCSETGRFGAIFHLKKGKAPISSVGGGDDGDFLFLSRLTNRHSFYHGTGGYKRRRELLSEVRTSAGCTEVMDFFFEINIEEADLAASQYSVNLPSLVCVTRTK